MRATHLLVQGHVEPDTGEKCCICGCGTDGAYKGTDFFGNPEGRGVGRLVWEKEYYGDVLSRMGTTL